jgi:hypothetical protein
MKFSMRVVVAALLTVCVMMWAGSAWAGVSVAVQHLSRASLMNGKPSYNDAAFQSIEFLVEFDDPTDISVGRNYFSLEAASFSLKNPDNTLYYNENKPIDLLDDAWIPMPILWPINEANTSYMLRAWNTNTNTNKASFLGEAQNRRTGIPNKDFRWELG